MCSLITKKVLAFHESKFSDNCLLRNLINIPKNLFVFLGSILQNEDSAINLAIFVFAYITDELLKISQNS